jgi:probable addiction module antidote protein
MRNPPVRRRQVHTTLRHRARKGHGKAPVDVTAKDLKLTKWDSAEFLRDDEDVALYLEAVIEDGDPALLSHALGVVARARGMTRLAKETGLAREALYRALSRRGNPSFTTVMKVTKALGLKITVALV